MIKYTINNDRHSSFIESWNALPYLIEDDYYQYVQEMMMIYPAVLARYDTDFTIMMKCFSIALRRLELHVADKCLVFGLSAMEKYKVSMPKEWAVLCLKLHAEDHVIAQVFKRDKHLAIGMYIMGGSKYSPKYMPYFLKDYHCFMHNVLAHQKNRDDYLPMSSEEQELWERYHILGNDIFLSAYHDTPAMYEEVPLII